MAENAPDKIPRIVMFRGGLYIRGDYVKLLEAEALRRDIKTADLVREIIAKKYNGDDQ
jgi:hypothetical protein